ncbi:MAG: hypothetical protein NTU93_16320 [Arthrobacter sp.]|nr:hypothetical protein [Arthrobacter sp.]
MAPRYWITAEAGPVWGPASVTLQTPTPTAAGGFSPLAAVARAD